MGETVKTLNRQSELSQDFDVVIANYMKETKSRLYLTATQVEDCSATNPVVRMVAMRLLEVVVEKARELCSDAFSGCLI